MRVAAIADVHGNLPALEAVFEQLHAVDRIVCAGDIVGYNPWPRECVDRLRRRNIPCVSGNHDRAVAKGSGFRFNAMAQAGVEYATAELEDDDIAWLSSLPASHQFHDGRINIVHGHPDDPDRYTFPGDFSPDLLGNESVLVMGHTHKQHVETYPDGIVLNPGSVGQPRDGDPRAAYAIIDLDTESVELCRVAYDIDRVRAAIDDAGLPRALGERLVNGR